MGRFLFALAISVWFGTAISFSYVFLPVIHAAMEGRAARHLLQRLFPVYYTVGIACGLTALAVVAAAPVGPTLPQEEKIRLAVPVAVGVLCCALTRQVLLPRLAEIDIRRDEQKYLRVHQLAAMLNTTVVALLGLVMAAVATR